MLFSEQARLRRLKAATGVAYPRGYRVFRRLVWWVSKLFAQFTVVGLENLPAPDGKVRGLDYYPRRYSRRGRSQIDNYAYVIVPNHRSVLDIPALGAMRRPKAIVGKAPFAMVLPVAWLFKRMGLVPIRRAQDGHSKLPGVLGRLMVKWRLSVTYRTEEMLQTCTAALHRGIPVEIYAAGSRKDTTTKRGPFLLACRAGVPIVPVAISGCAKGDKGTRSKWLRRRLIVVRIGEPITVMSRPYGQIEQMYLDHLCQKWEERVAQELAKADEQRQQWHQQLSTV